MKQAAPPDIVTAWLRVDLRRRGRSLAVLTLLIALAGAIVMASLAGARRGASAQRRLDAVTLPATSVILANTPGFDWNKIRALPEVDALTTFVVDYAVAYKGLPADVANFPPGDSAMMRTIEKPVVYRGRVFNPASDDEVVVTRHFASQFHKGVGDTVVLELPTAKQLPDDVEGISGALKGPQLTMHIVGVVGSPWFSDSPDEDGQIMMSPGVVARYPANTIGNQKDPNNRAFINALVRLRGGESAIPRLRADVARVAGRSNIDVWDLPEMKRDMQRQFAFEARCLAAFAGAAFLAALFLIGQAVTRYVAAGTTELQTLRALGMTPRQSVATAAAGPILSGVLGALLGVVGAFLLSEWTPIGTTSLIEPSPGLNLDWTVLAPGFVVIAVLVGLASVAAGWFALGAIRRSATSRRSAVASAAATAGLPVPVVVGTRFALESGRGQASVPARPALIGAVAGVLGIIAAFTFSHGVSDAASHPERFGQTFQLEAFVGINSQDLGPTNQLVSTLQANREVTGVDDARTSVATGPHDAGSVSLFEYGGTTKSIPVIVSSGRMPRADDEVLLGPRTIAALHTRVGARIQLDGNKSPVTYLVSGAGLVPEGPHNTYADGGWLTPAAYDKLFKGFKYHLILVSLRPEARTAAAAATLTAAVTKAHPDLAGLSLSAPDPPSEVAQIRQVRVLPLVLGCFLALLAIGAVGHALATAVRRRSHDLAVLRAVGMTPWQCRWVVITQATVLAVVGLVFGVPLGLALGRLVWRAVADYTPIEYVPPLAIWALLLVAPAALLVTNLLAAWPGHRAAMLRVASILRTE